MIVIMYITVCIALQLASQDQSEKVYIEQTFTIPLVIFSCV